MDIVSWHLEGLKILECAILPSPMGNHAHTMLVHGQTKDEEEVLVNLPYRLRTFNIKEVVGIICDEASRIQRRDLAEALLIKAFGEHVGKRALMDSGYFRKLESATEVVADEVETALQL